MKKLLLLLVGLLLVNVVSAQIYFFDNAESGTPSNNGWSAGTSYDCSSAPYWQSCSVGRSSGTGFASTLTNLSSLSYPFTFQGYYLYSYSSGFGALGLYNGDSCGGDFGAFPNGTIRFRTYNSSCSDIGTYASVSSGVWYNYSVTWYNSSWVEAIFNGVTLFNNTHVGMYGVTPYKLKVYRDSSSDYRLDNVLVASGYGAVFNPLNVTAVYNAVNGSSLSYCVSLNDSLVNNSYGCNLNGASAYFDSYGPTSYLVTNVSGGSYLSVGRVASFDRNVSFNTSQGVINVSAFLLWRNWSLSGFNVTNGLAKNTTVTNNFSVIPANAGTNNIKVDVAGNYSLNYSVTVSAFESKPYNATGVYDDFYTIGASNGSDSISSFSVVLSSLSFWSNLYSASTTNGSVGLPVLQGYKYNFTVSSSGYYSQTQDLAANSSSQTKNFTLTPINTFVTFLEEKTRRPLIGTNVTFSVIDSLGVQRAYNTNTSNASITNISVGGAYTIRYFANDYSTRDYYFTVPTQNVSIVLYLINTSVYTVGTVEVRNYDGSLINGAVITLRRYYSDPSLPNIVQMATSNENGMAVMTGEAVTASYTWEVTYGGRTLYNVTTPEILSVGNDYQWHRTFLAVSDIVTNTTSVTQWIYTWSPSMVLRNGTGYSFVFNISNATGLPMSSCALSLYDKTTGLLLASTTGGVSGRYCAAVSTYTVPFASDGINAVGSVTYERGTVTFTHAFSVYLYVDEEFTVQDLLDDLGGFEGAGFNDFSKALLGLIIIIAVLISAGQQWDFIRNTDEMLLLATVLTFFFCYIGWFTVPLNITGTGTISDGANAVVNSGLAVTIKQYILFMIMLLISIIRFWRRSGAIE